MNKRFFAVVIGLVFCAGTVAQAQIHTQVGIVAGLSMYGETLKKGSTSTAYDSKTGLVAGAVLDISLLDIVSIEPGLVYSMRNSSYTTTILFLSATTEDDLSYMAIPLHAKVRWPGIPVLKPYALAGLNLGFLVSAKRLTTLDTADVSSDYTTMDLGLDFGAGLEFDLPVIVPYVEFVYDVGMSNIAKNAASDESAKLSGSEIKAGIRFKL